MSFIDVKVNEGQFQQELVNAIIAASANWSISKTFYKIACEASWIDPQGTKLDTDNVNMKVARHVILANSAFTNSYLGIAIVGELKPEWQSIPVDSRPVNSQIAADNAAFIAWVQAYVENLEPTGPTDPKFTKFFNSTSVYFYMLERLPDVVADSYNVVFLELANLLQGCLDIEVWKTAYSAYQVWNNTDQVYDTLQKLVITEPQAGVMQSPISHVLLRSDKLEDFFNEQYNVFQNNTNWWYDSKVAIRGYVNADAISLIMQSDPVPAWEDNIVPSIPLYYGLIEPFNDSAGVPLDYDAIAFFAGTTPETSLTLIPKYDFDDYDKGLFQPFTNPILKSYPRHPSNGVNTVMLQRAKQGARYQQYYLSWNTAPNGMSPDRMDQHDTDFSDDTFNRDYPRAWNQQGSDEYKYWFNPSRYSGKIHTSKIYVMHPEEGLVGALYNIIGLSPIGIMSGKIKVLVDPCVAPNYKYYRYFVVDSISPVTTRPGTAYRPIGLGIYDDTPIV